MLERGEVVEVGYRQWWYRDLLLAGDMQRNAAGDEHGEAWGRGQQVSNQRCRRRDLLKIVEQQQELFGGQELAEAGHEWLPSRLRHMHRLRDG